MRNVLTALLITIVIGSILTVGVGLTIIGIPTVTEFTYAECISVDDFTNRMDIYSGRLLTDGDTQAGNVFVVLYPDNSFGLFIHLEAEDAVCAISNGWFAPPPLPSANT